MWKKGGYIIRCIEDENMCEINDILMNRMLKYNSRKRKYWVHPFFCDNLN
jgi:hypothetical protein